MARADSEAGLVARSRAVQRLLELAERVAPTDATVLITGETGTGKERLARLIHARSRRRNGAFLALDCGALPESLLESELFGHKKGAFTGAGENKKGLLEAARGGTVFLDEIGDTSAATQVRLLRALQERRVRPVGATAEIAVDVRVISATHRDLEELARTGAFRQDLYFRLRVVHLHVPPLRERREDLVPLARRFIAAGCSEYSCGPCTLSPEALDLLTAYPWPGNVRELENAIERAVVLAERKPCIEAGDLPPEIRRGPPALPAPGEEVLTLAEAERHHILAVLERFGGNRGRTAQALAIGETTLWRKLKCFGLVRQRPSLAPDPGRGCPVKLETPSGP